MKYSIKISIFLFIFSLSHQAFAFKNKAYGLGIGYYSQNFLNQTSQNASGSSSMLGEPNYPLNIKYDYSYTPTWYMSPQLGYTFFPRSTQGSTAKVTLLHLELLFGTNFGAGSNWDWYVGPGIMQEDIKGNGGTTVMNNGTSTATFALPGRTATVRKVTLNVGSSWTLDKSRLGLEIILENAFSSSKRAQSLMFSYSYLFSSTGGAK